MASASSVGLFVYLAEFSEKTMPDVVFRFQNVTQLLNRLSGHSNSVELEEPENVKNLQPVSPSISGMGPVRRRRQLTKKVGRNGAIPVRKRKLDSRAFEYCFQ